MNPSTCPDSPADRPRIAFVLAGWHGDIVAQSLAGFREHIEQSGLDPLCIETFEVPGSLEIPLQCKRLAKTGRYDVIVAAGFIVNGGIYRHEFVSTAVLNGIMQVQLETDVPVLSIVLTPHHFNGEQAHHEFFFSHFHGKGEEAAEACISILGNREQLHAVPDAGMTSIQRY